ncbi:MAG: Uma2 family endonuclease [Vulcanimicrobiaceae bacterium]
MQNPPELGIPEVKPAIESIRGRWVQKMSPQRRHAILQSRLARAFTDWAETRGEVGTEWRFYLLPPGEKVSSLVPDVAFFSYARLPVELGEAREKPTVAPDIAVEVLSPDDRRALLEEKIELYFANDCKLVGVVDPGERVIEMHAAPNVMRAFGEGEAARSPAFDDLALDVTALFTGL